MSNKTIKITIKEGPQQESQRDISLLQEKFVPGFIRNMFQKDAQVQNRSVLSSGSLPFDDVTTLKDSLEQLMVHHFGEDDHEMTIESIASELRGAFGARRFINLYSQEFKERGIPTDLEGFSWNPVPNGKEPQAVELEDKSGDKKVLITAEEAREFAEDEKKHLNDTIASLFAGI